MESAHQDYPALELHRELANGHVTANGPRTATSSAVRVEYPLGLAGSVMSYLCRAHNQFLESVATGRRAESTYKETLK